MRGVDIVSVDFAVVSVERVAVGEFAQEHSLHPAGFRMTVQSEPHVIVGHGTVCVSVVDGYSERVVGAQIVEFWH